MRFVAPAIHGPAGSFSGAMRYHSCEPCTSYVRPCGSCSVKRSASLRRSVVMGLPFGGDGWCRNPIINPAGNPARTSGAQAAIENVAQGVANV